jgi:hypothetical protein
MDPTPRDPAMTGEYRVESDKSPVLEEDIREKLHKD